MKKQKIAKKNDKGKSPIGLLPTRPLFDVADVMYGGKFKYGAHNWRDSMEWSRALDASLRHILKWKEIESIDKEFNKSHLAHAVANLLFLMEWEYTNPENDDRFMINRKKK